MGMSLVGILCLVVVIGAGEAERDSGLSIPAGERAPLPPPETRSGNDRKKSEPRAPSIALCNWYVDAPASPASSAVSAEPTVVAAPIVPTARPIVKPLGVRACRPCAPRSVVTGVDSAACVPCGEPTWSMRGPVPWEAVAQGEYIGPHRNPHVPSYRLRVDDQIELIYRLTRERSARPYELAVADRVRVESIADKTLDRELIVQPDGTLTLPLTGQVLAAGRTTDQIRVELEQRYKKYYKEPAITVTPLSVNTKLEDLRNTVDSRQGQGGQSRQTRVAPDGTISLPALGVVPAHGLSLDELKQEINARYATMFDGVEVTPVLVQRAPRFIYVVGAVQQPGRYELVGPTTVIQSISLARGSLVGANLRQIVIFRRANDWRLLATKVDVRGAIYGQRPAPSDELWLRDSDVVIVPKSPVRTATDVIQLVGTDGVYAAAPFLRNIFFFTGGDGGGGTAVLPPGPVGP